MFVFSNLATSIDGKIATHSRELVWLGTSNDHKHMRVLRKRADVILVGAGTLRTYRQFSGVPSRVRQPANTIVSSALEGISPDWPFFKNPKHHRVLFLSRVNQISKPRLRAFEKTSEIVSLDPKKPVAPQIVKALSSRGFKKLLVEGGGDMMWNFSSLNLINEYHVTLTPKVVGGRDAPTMIEGLGFAPKKILPLKLKSCVRKGDELFLTYRK